MIQRIYLDNNATAPLDPRLADFLIKILPSLQGNPSSSHQYGQTARALISQARHIIASYLKVKLNELIFTSGGTESVNLAIRGIISNKPVGHVITSSVEHACVMANCQKLEEKGYHLTYLSTGIKGSVSLEDVEAAIRPDTRLITLMAANNETGVKNDIEGIAAIANRHNIPFFVDAISLLGKGEIVIPLGVSAMAFSGHKIHALQGVGLLFLRSGVKMQSLLIGGEHEYGRRAGTENLLGIASFGKAVELLSLNHIDSIQNLRNRFEKTILKDLPGTFINGEGLRTCNVSNLAFSGVDGESLLMNLDRHGVAASHGSACSSGSLEPSRVLVEMGLPIERVNGSIRFSLSRLNTQEEIDVACKIIIKLVRACSKSSIG